MITEHHLEEDGDRVLFRLAVHSAAALDVLTDAPTLAGARAALAGARGNGLAEYRLGAFGPFDVVISTTDARTVAIAVDGPDHGPAFRGNQSVVFYVGLDELLAALPPGAADPSAEAAPGGGAEDRAHDPKCREEVYVVLRADPPWGPEATVEELVTAKEVVRSAELAEREVARLAALRPPGDGVRYWYRYSRLYPPGRAAGPGAPAA